MTKLIPPDLHILARIPPTLGREKLQRARELLGPPIYTKHKCERCEGLHVFLKAYIGLHECDDCGHRFNPNITTGPKLAKPATSPPVYKPAKIKVLTMADKGYWAAYNLIFKSKNPGPAPAAKKPERKFKFHGTNPFNIKPWGK